MEPFKFQGCHERQNLPICTERPAVVHNGIRVRSVRSDEPVYRVCGAMIMRHQARHTRV